MMEEKKIIFTDDNHVIVPSESGTCNIPDYVLIRLHFFLLEFVVNYRSKKKKRGGLTLNYVRLHQYYTERYQKILEV